MQNILSQDEVDSLLQAVESGDVVLSDEDEEGDESLAVTHYDFRRANLITRENLRLLNTLHENIARDLQSWLFLVMRSNVDIAPITTEQQHFREFILSLPDTTHLIVVRLQKPPGVIVIEIGLPLLFGVVDLLLGGDGAVSSDPVRLGDVEQAVADPLMQRLQEQILVGLQLPTLDMIIQDVKTESNPEYVHALTSDAAVITMTMDVHIGEAAGLINICIELPIAQKILGHDIDDEDGHSAIPSALLDVPVTLHATLGEACLPATDLLSLAQGDIIILDTKIRSHATLSLGNKPLYSATPGRRATQSAVKLREAYKRETQATI